MTHLCPITRLILARYPLNTDIILSDNCQQSIPVGLDNLQNSVVQRTTCTLDETQAYRQKENIPTTIFKWQLGHKSWYSKLLQARSFGPQWGEIFHNRPDRPKATLPFLKWVLGLLATGKAARVWC
jgi:hypothetical protein